MISEKYGDPVLKIDHSGCYAYVYDGATQIKENTSEATISQYRIMLDGSIVPLQPAVIHLGRIAIWDLILHPDGRSIYAICSKWDGKDEDEECVMQLHVGSDGGLTPLVPAEAPIGAYGTSFVIAPNGQNSYTIGGKDGLQIDQYRISPLGELSPLASIKIPSATPGASVTLDPAGHFAYVVSQDDGVIHQFQIGAQGALTALKQKKVDTGTLPNILYIDPQTHFLCLSNLHGGDLALYRINGGALAPAKPGTLNTDTAPVSVAFVLR